MEVAVAVAGIIRQQACSLGVWCPEEEGEEEEEEVPVRTHTHKLWRLVLTHGFSLPQPPLDLARAS